MLYRPHFRRDFLRSKARKHAILVGYFVITVFVGLSIQSISGATIAGPWSVERATDWQQGNPWLVGCNYITSSAVNQLEMWQADTFDLSRIDRELGWAEGLGFNSVRVFLHNLLWTQDA